MKYVFMGTPEFAADILDALCEKFDMPVAVVTQPSRPFGRGQKLTPNPVELLARQKDLMLIPTDDVNLPANVSLLKALHPDLLLVAAFGQLLKAEILALPTQYCLNVHASLLPKYRGAAPIQRSIWDGDRVTGITIQRMERKLDTGDILVQRELPIDPEETSGELTRRLAKLGGECLVEAVERVIAGTAILTPQDHTLATHAAKIGKDDAPIDWSQPANRIKNQIRALQPWPVAGTTVGGERMKIFRAEVIAGMGRPPGEIATDAKTYLHVQCGGSTALSLTEIQLESKKRLDVKNFLAGFRGNFTHQKLGA